MSFGVIVTNRLALPARGATTNTDTLFLACKVAQGPLTKPTLCRSILDFEAAYSPREGMSVETWDYLDVYFREGGKRAYVGAYATNYTDAFDLFDPRLGPGQLSVIGTAPSAQVYADMKTECEISNGPSMTNRVALRDVLQGQTVTQMEAMGDEAPSADDVGATFGPWVQVPGPSGVYGAGPRYVQASAVIAGLCARVDANGNPNRAAAGDDYPLQYVTGFMEDVSDTDRAGLFQHGVNAFGSPFGVLENYGFQTNLAMSEDNPFWQFNCSRARMFLKARAQARGQRYMFRNIDGQGKLAGALKSDLDEEFHALWNVDGLFGATPAEAYYTEVGEVVNTVDEIAQGHLHAVGQARFSLATKAVFVDLVTVPVTSPVG